jgi:proteasome lid subunit RPN8/RPN11
MFKEVIIESDAIELMQKDAIQAFPNECCGFMYGYEEGNSRKITIAVPVINSKDGDQRRRFEISPIDYMRAENYALSNNLNLLGVYHSHPLHPAIPSQHDLVQAMPFFSYLILSVTDNKVEAIKSWQLDEGTEKFIEEKLNY